MNSQLTVRIKHKMATFSKGQKLIAQYILEHSDKVAFMTASKLGATVGVSESTVVRFATEIGYAGYPELQKAIQETNSPILKKALAWSKAVNEGINALPEEVKRPFPGAKEGLAAAAQFADIAIVSSANRDAVLEEWTKYELLDHVDVMLAQDCGSKAHCIAEMLKFGYAPDHVLMVGDAPGDQDAAAKNGVYYYPILVRHEEDSWTELRESGFSHLQNGTYTSYEKERIAAFLKNLGG